MHIPDSVTVSIPSQDGFLGRECNGPSCKKYFKISSENLSEEMYCPYCGEKFRKDELWDPDDLDYAKNVALEEVKESVHREIQDMFKNTFSKSGNWTYKAGSPYRKKPVPLPTKKTVDSELSCPECESTFQVYGIFGYCPICRTENILLYDANWAIIKQEIAQSSNSDRALRHAYSDLVSTFEFFCRRNANLHSIEQGRFQNIQHTRALFRKELQIDLFANLSQEEVRIIKRVFEKRHVSEHNGGIISQRYIDRIPEDKDLLGEKVELSVEELDQAANIMKSMLDNLVQ